MICYCSLCHSLQTSGWWKRLVICREDRYWILRKNTWHRRCVAYCVASWSIPVVCITEIAFIMMPLCRCSESDLSCRQVDNYVPAVLMPVFGVNVGRQFLLGFHPALVLEKKLSEQVAQPGVLPVTHPAVSKHWRKLKALIPVSGLACSIRLLRKGSLLPLVGLSSDSKQSFFVFFVSLGMIFKHCAILVHGQVTIIFVVSVCLFVQSFSQPSSIRFGSN